MCEDFVLSFYFPHQLLAVVTSPLVSLSLALSTGWSLEQRGAPPQLPIPSRLRNACSKATHGRGRWEPGNWVKAEPLSLGSASLAGL